MNIINVHPLIGYLVLCVCIDVCICMDRCVSACVGIGEGRCVLVCVWGGGGVVSVGMLCVWARG